MRDGQVVAATRGGRGRAVDSAPTPWADLACVPWTPLRAAALGSVGGARHGTQRPREPLGLCVPWPVEPIDDLQRTSCLRPTRSRAHPNPNPNPNQIGAGATAMKGHYIKIEYVDRWPTQAFWPSSFGQHLDFSAAKMRASLFLVRALHGFPAWYDGL